MLVAAVVLLAPAASVAQPAASAGAAPPAEDALFDEFAPAPGGPGADGATVPAPPASPYRASVGAEVGAAPAATGVDARARAARLEAYDQRHGVDAEGEGDPEAPDPGYHRHDGFLLRLALGVGAGALRLQGSAYGLTDDWRDSPVGYQSISLGGALADNWILHADVHGFVDGDEADYQDPRRGTGWIGLGLSYYVMPNNVYVSASVGPAATVLTDDRYERRERSLRLDREVLGGVGAGLFVGKEWWVHDNWGLGLAAGLLYTFATGNTEHGTEDLSLHSLATTLSLSLTYN
jgi:hypothetical protein